jgi:hypothetical protein
MMAPKHQNHEKASSTIPRYFPVWLQPKNFSANNTTTGF